MVIKIRFKKEEVDIDFSDRDLQSQTTSFIKKKDVQGAITNLDQKARKLETARRLASEKLELAEANLANPAVQLQREKFEADRDDALKDLDAIERLDSEVGNLVWKIRQVEKQRPELAARGEMAGAKVPPPGGYAKMIKKPEEKEEREVWLCENKDCPGKGKTVKISTTTDICPFCKKKLRFIGEEEK